MAIYIRIKEFLMAPFIAYMTIAEERYSQELPFLKKKTEVILNKYHPLRTIPSKKARTADQDWKFLFSGTISEEYGINDAINFVKEINTIKRSTLYVIGHCPNYQLFKTLKKEEKKHLFLKLTISHSPVDHHEIEEEYYDTDFALTPYPYNPSTENCIPVKFYEYIAHKIPVLIPGYNSYWISFLSKYQAHYTIDFKEFSIERIIGDLNQQVFYGGEHPKDIFWESESVKLLNILANLS